jgi:hypothetical protein
MGTLRSRISPLAIGIFSILTILIFAPVVVNMIANGNDATANIRYAAFWEDSGFYGRPRPHFLFQVLVIVVSRFIPGLKSFALAGVVVGIVSYLFLGVVIYRLIAPLFAQLSSCVRSPATIGCALALMLVGPVSIFTLLQHNLYWGYIVVYSYQNPPMILLAPFALLLFLLTLRVFSGDRARIPLILTTAAIAFLSTIAKPSYAICFVPALALLTLIALLRKQSIDWRLLLVGIVVPLGVVLFWQNQYHTTANMGGFAFEPLKVMSFYSDNLLPKLLLSILFPAAVMLLYWKDALRNKSLQLAWITLFVGLSYTYLLSETEGWTVSWTDGNFIWSSDVALFILFIASALFFLRQWFTNQRWTWKTIACLTLFSLHLVGGVALYLSSLSPAWRSWL